MIGRNCKVDRTAIISDTAEIGEACIIYPYVIIGENVKIGSHSILYPKALIYREVKIGEYCRIGNDASIREGCKIGHHTQIGQKVGMECYTTIGNYTSIESQSHITGWMEIGDYVFVGGAVMTTNDLKMKYKREGHGNSLKGAKLCDYSRIGSGSILLPGVVVGKHSIVSVGEIVRKDIPDNTLMFTAKGKVIHKTIKPEEVKKDE